MTKNTSDYFRKLFDSLNAVEVTNQQGTSLPLEEGIGRALDLIISMTSDAGKVMLIGNGGSAAIASHAQNDLCKAAGIRALVFTEQPLLTALSNDLGYASVFEMPLRLWAEKGNVLIAISSSGRSENILRAVQTSLARGCNVITFSGFHRDNPLREKGHLNFYIPSENYGCVEIAHMSLTHLLTDRLMELRGETMKQTQSTLQK